MKKDKLNFKNLFKNDFEISLVKIVFTLFIYLIIIFIFKAGYELQRTVDFKSKVPPAKIEKVNYKLIINSKPYEVNLGGKKDLYNIIISQKDFVIDYLAYYKGVKIVGINNLKNISIKVNGVEVKDNFISDSYKEIDADTKIEITAY